MNPIVECPICHYVGDEFLPFGLVKRTNALCPSCGALERHRMAWRLFEHTNLFRVRLSMLDIAPITAISARLQSHKNIDYLSADLLSPTAMVKMDLTNIQFPGSSFDVIYCSHVLEHIPDDRLAMRELVRVLRPGGWALLVVPMYGVTLEDPSITDPKERERRFGQFDHVRVYGLDGVFESRLEQVGFKVSAINPVEGLDPAIIRKYGLRDERMHLCKKPS